MDFGGILGDLGSLEGELEGILGGLGGILGHFGAILGGLGGFWKDLAWIMGDLGGFSVIWGESWRILVGVWRVLEGVIFGDLGGSRKS